MTDKPSSPLYQAIYQLVRRVPAGRVTTYGKIGQLAGCTARTVGFALAAVPPGTGVPWQRVVNSQGRVSPRRDGEGNLLQYDLLVAEGIVFDVNGTLDLMRYLHRFPLS